jgi:hypothetical protein
MILPISVGLPFWGRQDNGGKIMIRGRGTVFAFFALFCG